MLRNTIKGLVLLFIVYSAQTFAEDTFYIGAEGGYADIRHSDFDDDVTYKAYIGWNIVRAISIEASYGYLGEFDVTDGDNSVELKNVSHLALVFSGPFINNVSTEMIVKLGGYYLDIEPNIANGISESDDEQGFTLGYGLAQPIGEHFAATFNWQYYWDVDDVDISTYSLGVQYNF